jgi:hypothetical protein
MSLERTLKIKIVRDHSQADAASKDFAAKEKGRNQETKQGYGQVDEAVKGLATSFAALTVGRDIMGSLINGAKELGAAIRANNDEIRKQAQELIKEKDALRELYAMTGGKGAVTGEEVRKLQTITIASGMDRNAARGFSLELAGAGEASRGKTISDAEYERLKPQLARFAMSMGGGADAAATYGKLGGLLLGTKKWNKAEDVVGSMAGVSRILGLGVGENPELVKQSAQVMGMYLQEGGMAKDEKELAALVAGASRINPSASGETLKQMAAAVRGFSGKQKDYLKQVGAGEQDTVMAASEKIFADIDKAKGNGRKVDAYLQERGFGDVDARVLMNMYAQRDFMKGALAEKMPTAGEAKADIDKAFRDDISLQTKLAEAKLDRAKLALGETTQGAEPLRIEAEAAITGRSTPASEWWTGTSAGSFLPGNGGDSQKLGHEIAIEQEMYRRAKEKGYDVPNRPSVSSVLGGWNNAYVNWIASGEYMNMYGATASEMESERQFGAGRQGSGAPRAGAPRAIAGDKLDKAADKLDKAADKLAPKTPRPLPSRPVMPIGRADTPF